MKKEDKQMKKFYTMFVLLCMITYIIYHRAEAFVYQYSEFKQQSLVRTQPARFIASISLFRPI